MATNAVIKQALFKALSDAALGYPIAWEGVDFTPPATGFWLEPAHFANKGNQPGFANDASEYMQGIFQINVFTRSGSGVIAMALIAETVKGVFARGTTITGNVRVTRARTGNAISNEDKIFIPVTIEYAGS